MKRLLPLALLLAGCATAGPTIHLAGAANCDTNMDGLCSSSDYLTVKAQLGKALPPRYLCIEDGTTRTVLQIKGSATIAPVDPVAAVKACWP